MRFTIEKLLKGEKKLRGCRIMVKNLGFCDYTGTLREICGYNGHFDLICDGIIWRLSDDKDGNWSVLSGEKWFTFFQAKAKLVARRKVLHLRVHNDDGSATRIRIFL